MADVFVIPAGGASNSAATFSATDGGAGDLTFIFKSF